MGDGAELVTRFLGCMRTHDWDGMIECVADDFSRTGPYEDVVGSRNEYRTFISELLPTLPGYVMDIDRVVASADGRVVMVELSETIDWPDGRHRTPESLVFDLADDGRIRRISVYIQTRPPKGR